jgi:hypothetical protein
MQTVIKPTGRIISWNSKHKEKENDFDIQDYFTPALIYL